MPPALVVIGALTRLAALEGDSVSMLCTLLTYIGDKSLIEDRRIRINREPTLLRLVCELVFIDFFRRYNIYIIS